MTIEWETFAIEDICEVYDGPHATPERTESGPVFLGISSLSSGRISLELSDRISEEDFIRWTRRVEPRSGDLVFSYETRLGEAALIPEGLRCCLGRRMGLLRIKDSARVDPRFLLYNYLGPAYQAVISKRTVYGSTVERIPLKEVPRFPMILPPIGEQQAIAHVLGTLDDKIELNRKTNTTLEAMARALFKSWFVDFDPVRAKAEGRATGLPDEISDLFPDSFEETELGEIPRGWEVQAISEVVDSIFDGPHATPAESDTGHVFLGIKNMSGTRIELDEIRLIHDDDWEAWTRRVEPQPNDIVFTYEAALGLFGLIPPKLKCCLGRRMALIRPLSENGSPHFWFHQFIADPFQRIITERCIHGATVNRTPLRKLWITGRNHATMPL